MGKLLYLQCASGISGDMTVAALLDLGADREKLAEVLASLHLEGYTWSSGRTRSYGLDGCTFRVNLVPCPEHTHSHEHCHGADHTHPHEHSHAEEGTSHHPPHDHAGDERNLEAILHILSGGALTSKARTLAEKMFRIVAEAESEAHGIPVNQVHFHEVGAVDSIVDIVATAFCIDDLGIDEVIVSPLAEGSGTIQCQHGVLPVPVPAVLAIARRYAIPLRIGPEQTELVTPTGAAIVAALHTRTELPAEFTIERMGFGAGTRDIGRSNLLRAMILKPKAQDPPTDQIRVFETNVDDVSGEALALALEKLFAAGVRDAHFQSVYMKKNRPGWLVRVIADKELTETVEAILFEYTNTIGLRYMDMNRTVLKRNTIQVQLPEGTVEVKRVYYRDKVYNHPEFESVRSLAETTGVSFQTLYAAAVAAADGR